MLELDDVRVAILQGAADCRGRERQADEIAERAQGDLARLARIIGEVEQHRGDVAMLLAALLEPAVADAYERARRPWRERIGVAWRVLTGR